MKWLFHFSTDNLQGWKGISIPNLKPTGIFTLAAWFLGLCLNVISCMTADNSCALLPIADDKNVRQFQKSRRNSLLKRKKKSGANMKLKTLGIKVVDDTFKVSHKI